MFGWIITLLIVWRMVDWETRTGYWVGLGWVEINTALHALPSKPGGLGFGRQIGFSFSWFNEGEGMSK